jgi:uncharacterized protein
MTEAERARRPWHEGELAVQRLASSNAPAPVIRTFLTEQLRVFFPQLSLLFLAGVDAEGFPSPTVLRGAPGFIACPEPTRLEIGAALPVGDPLERVLRPGASVGLLGIDFRTRRRNRVNGRVASIDARGCIVDVAEAFGNCPRYIRERETVKPLASSASWEPLDDLDATTRRAVADADAFFVASSSREKQGDADISHRGGPPGFVSLEADGAISIPDYKGNGYFNTLGNLIVHPEAGLLFPDFNAGEALRLVGVTEIIWRGDEVAAHPGAERLWKFRPRRAWRLKRVGPRRI